MKFLAFSQTKLGSSLSLPAHGKGWGKGNTFSCGAFCEAKYEIRRRRKSEGGAGRKRGLGKRNSRPARAKIIKSQRRDFRGKKFGFCSGQTALELHNDTK